MGIETNMETESYPEKYGSPTAQMQYFYDHILCLREWLESLYEIPACLRYGQNSFTSFEIEINEEQVTIKTNCFCPSDCNNNSTSDNDNDDNDNDGDNNNNDNDNNDNDNNGDHNVNDVNNHSDDDNAYDIQLGDEFAYICQEGQLALSNAMQYIVFGEYVDFTNEEQQEEKEHEKESNNKTGNGWNLIDLLKADDEIEKNEFGEIFFKRYLLWKENLVIFFFVCLNKVEYIYVHIYIEIRKGTNNLFVAMLNKAHKSIQALTMTHEFDQIMAFPVLPNLVHLNLKDIIISNCFSSINVNELMPQLKTLKVEGLSKQPCTYCNWKQAIEAVETYGSDENESFPVPYSYFPYYERYDCSEIKFLNHCLLSCPNLLAFCYISGHDTPEEVLKIPSTLEWLMIDSNEQFANSIQLDLSQCKHINGLIKKKKELEISSCQMADGNNGIEYWNDLLSSPTKCCDVQLCAVLPNRTVHDLTSDNLIFPLAHQSLCSGAQTIAERPGIHFEDAKKELHRSSNNDEFQRSMPFFQKVVDVMGIDNAKKKEYQRWFDIDEASWILDLFCLETYETQNF
ncbi:hypothetical protein RFI_11122 [Reticulomyxa filosa]|uniref:Uncharacterized protein n=1 Tax=Reticulomyxa filosa TaxID=46433 RepID=X6NI69_RETFI|nr:hypothetical protein RFI_11122 [Reticulomyxa filosa]|eukprot:ETO26015.1 hypothetical protein RFI_11122 [Reticulomyxa filosa]